MKQELDIISKAYLQLAKHIKQNVKEIRWIDLWADQLFSNTEAAYAMPAVFIEIISNEIETVGKGVQHISVDILFHLAYDSYAKSYQGSYNQTESLKFGAIMNQLYKCIQNYSGFEITTAMDRNAIRREPAPPYVYHYVNAFSTVLVDESAIVIANNELSGLTLEVPEKNIGAEISEIEPEESNPKELKFDLDL